MMLCTLGASSALHVAYADFGNQMQTGIQDQHSGISSFNSGIGGTQQRPAGGMERFQNGFNNTTGPVDDTTGPQRDTTSPMNDTTGPSPQQRDMRGNGPGSYGHGTPMHRRIVIPQQDR